MDEGYDERSKVYVHETRLRVERYRVPEVAHPHLLRLLGPGKKNDTKGIRYKVSYVQSINKGKNKNKTKLQAVRLLRTPYVIARS